MVATRSVTAQEVVRVVRELGRPVRFGEIAERLAQRGFSRSQVHNAVYSLHKSGRLSSRGGGSTMTYTVQDE
jgi:hypothetical protein